MPYLRLRDLRDASEHDFETDAVRMGRNPDFELPITGSGSEVVSGAHAQFCWRDGLWWIEDLGGRNGTYVGDERVGQRQAVRVRTGMVVGLGQRGPRFKVEAVQQGLEATLIEERPGPAATVVEDGVIGPDDATLPMDLKPPPPRAEPRTPSTPPPPAPPPNPEPRAEAKPAAPAEPEPEAKTELAPKARVPEGPKGPPPLTLVLRDADAGTRHEATGGRIRIGRGRECELRPVEAGDTSVSRVHCEIVLKPGGGGAVVRDAQSRNGTMVNGQRLAGERLLARDDRIKLGDAGPTLVVESLLLPLAGSGAPSTPPPSGAADRAAGPAGEASPPARKKPAAPAPRRSFEGKGRTVFIKEMVEDTQRKSASKVRAVTWTFVALLAATLGGGYWYADSERRRTDAELQEQREALAAQQARADSVQAAALANVQQLSVALEDARRSSAPAAVVDSLRTALVSAQERTTQLEAALQRAQVAVNEQLAAGDSLRRAAQGEIERLRAELDRTAGSGGVAQEVLDSLRSAVRAAEDRAGEIEAGLRAVRGADLAHIAQENQAAVGLVSAFAPDGIYDGSGFVITADGYFVTNRHVVRPGGQVADSLFVTMADHRTMKRADIVNVAPPQGPDLAVLRIRNYMGPRVAGVDWAGTRARQGEPAALIGFPAGVAAALDQTRTVRTSMSAGIFSKVTPETIQFDGFTVGGSSGSPVFNASGEVVSVHAAGLREAAGLGFTVPVGLVLPLLPPEVRSEVTN